MKFNTRLLHGRAVDRYPHGSTLPPIIQANAYRYDSFEELERVFSHKAMGYAYSRIGNPTVTAFERRINELEGGAGSVATASGMAAISQTLLTIIGQKPACEEVTGTGDVFDGFHGLEASDDASHRTDDASLIKGISTPCRLVRWT